MANTTDKMNSPSNITFPADARELEASQDPKNTMQHVTRSGHLFEMNDNNGAEHITLQHRSGAMFQFLPDGKVTITSSAGMYTMVFGANQMYITGSHDIVVDGSASIKVKGDYNVTVDGDLNTSVAGDMNTVIGKNQNTILLGDQVLSAQNQTTKIAKNTEHTTEGKTYLGADGGIKVESTSGNMEINSKTGMTLVDSSGIDLNP